MKTTTETISQVLLWLLCILLMSQGFFISSLILFLISAIRIAFVFIEDF